MVNVIQHWLNWDKVAPLVVVSNDSSLCVGSCNSADLYSIDQKLSADVPIATALGNNSLTPIQFKNLVEIRYIQNDTAVRIQYRNKDKHEALEIELGSEKKAESLFDHLSQYVASHMIKRIGDKSRHYGTVLLMAGLFFSAVFLNSFFNIHRVAAYLIPAICVLGTVGYVVRMERAQRDLFRWTIDSDIKCIGTPAIRVMGIALVFSILSVFASLFFHDTYGEKALYAAAKRGTLEQSEISTYLNRGSNINFIHEDGTTALWWAIKHRSEPVSIGLITNGADVRANKGRLLEHAIQHQASEVLLRPMIEKGVLEVAERFANFDTKNYLESKNDDFTKVFYWYRTTY